MPLEPYRTDTVQKLLKELNDLGALQCDLEVYDLRGNQYDIVEIYTPGDDDFPTGIGNVVCIDVRKRGD